MHLPMQEMWIESLGKEDPLEEEMATHSSILAWKIPWTEESGGVQSTGSLRVRQTEHTPSQNCHGACGKQQQCITMNK